MRYLVFGAFGLALSGCVANGGGEQKDVPVGVVADFDYLTLFNSGSVALDQKLWSEAIAKETQAIERDPRLYPAYVDRGNAYGGEKTGRRISPTRPRRSILAKSTAVGIPRMS
jgi:hypothetical protein